MITSGDITIEYSKENVRILMGSNMIELERHEAEQLVFDLAHALKAQDAMKQEKSVYN